MDFEPLRPLLDHQSGIVSRRQLRDLDARPTDVRRWLRSRQLTPVFAGVYVNHTGPLTWSSRAWAAVHRYWPAALALESAVNLAGNIIQVGVAEGRSSLRPERGIQVHRLRDLDDRVQWNRSPPRQRLEDAVISMSSVMRRHQAVELITDVCRSRKTTPERLLRELSGRSNLKDRAWMLGVLDDAAHGVQSVLEHTYVHKVERAHGLPRSERQVRDTTRQGVIYRDVLYRAWGLVLELDGRLGHDLARDRAADLSRDLQARADGLITVRLGWQQVELDACATAAVIARILQRRGWSVQVRWCRYCGPGGVVRSGAIS